MHPIIPGFAPDPSVCRIGEFFYLVTSSFHLFPGIPIYESIDLVNWKHIGNAINRPSQLSLREASTKISPIDEGKLIATGGLFAPTIRHNKTTGVTYILCTNVRHGTVNDSTRNFILSTTDIHAGHWSDPVYYAFNGIDPSLFIEENGKAYIQGTHAPECHIHNFQVDLETLQPLCDPQAPSACIFTGWNKKDTEGPHIYKKDGWYFLLVSEGGTFANHMVTITRSRDLHGPYEVYEGNPIFTASPNDYIQHTGHADLFQDAHGKWYMVYLGVRKRGNRFILGRESFLTPVSWEGEWPVIRQQEGLRTTLSAVKNVDWVYLRDAELERYSLQEDQVSITASSVYLDSPDQTVSFMGKRQRELNGTSTVALDTVSDKKDHLRAGLAVYKDEHRFVALAHDFALHEVTLEITNQVTSLSVKKSMPVSPCTELFLRIRYTEEEYEFAFKEDRQWTVMHTLDTADMCGLDFVGPVIGMFAWGEGDVLFKGFTVDSIL
ncbi:hypothetical protein ASPZODRAFT_100182 [Penicilliopsis zonata CBS 506.65]|uniref:Beta-xylosidase C-terminal Concanavalin A-like domain-containing protein n=1 Tax=Penicilliopsis zonata CBS 506.65 TaxID=1073090 RepID=A0A1L9SD47_9EURO|nr:hypothetical protein ASPZODRAFT_100182 [Penicilliopsis zonata CBS 506.65]OJJ45052.1 hypothetical protein ASPZODRAFT_100182 [Penicilliopsis zonata CBS 506.65]